MDNHRHEPKTALANNQARRATVDDLTVLRRFWQQAGRPMGELEKRLREFQVVETADGTLLGAIALQIDQQQGRIHSEDYLDPDAAAALRPRLWERLQSLARSHGLQRVWIEQGASAFWLEAGFEPAGSQLTQKIPASFPAAEGRTWLTLKLREATEGTVLLEQELALFRQAQTEQGRRVLQQVRALKWLAAVTVVIVLMVMIAAVWSSLRHWHRLPHPR